MVNTSIGKSVPLNIVIGVGGNGSLLVDRFARSLPSESRNFLIYACDTHPTPREAGIGEIHESVKYIRWHTPEQRHLTKLGIKVEPRHVTDAIRQGKGEGALRFRDYGRACFFLNQQRLLQTIHDDVEREGQAFAISHVNFAIVTTLGGGTGSGAIIDLATSIKHVFARHTCYIDAYLVLPQGFVVKDDSGRVIVDFTTDENESAFSNAFGALLELREIIETNPHLFNMISLLSSYSLRDWENLDSVVTRFLNDFYTGSLAESGNLFEGMQADTGFVSIIPAVVEFPIALIREYIEMAKQIKERRAIKEGKEGERDRYISRSGQDESKHGSLIDSIRTLTGKVREAEDKARYIDSLSKGIRLFGALRLDRARGGLKLIYEAIFGTDRDKWDDLVRTYENIAGNLATLLDDPEFVNRLRLTPTFLEKGRAQDVSIGRIESRSALKGLVSPLIEGYDSAWKIRQEIKELNREIEELEQRERDLASKLERPVTSGIIPVHKRWLDSFLTGRIHLDDYAPPGGKKVLADLFEELLGDGNNALEFLAEIVDRSLRDLVNAVKAGFRQPLDERGLAKSAYRGNELACRLLVVSRSGNYSSEVDPRVKAVDKLVNNTREQLTHELGLIEQIQTLSSDLPSANTALRLYFVTGHMDVNQFPEWTVCKQRYMERTRNVECAGEAHAWGMEEGIWTNEQVDKVIREIESIESD